LSGFRAVPLAVAGTFLRPGEGALSDIGRPR
jgi:hypothetical protein